MIKKFINKILDVLFPPPIGHIPKAVRDARLLQNGQVNDGTIYGRKPYEGAEHGRELDRRSALVPPCRSYPDAGAHCGHFCGGPAPEQWVINGPDGAKA